jgi:hypothetical protein
MARSEVRRRRLFTAFRGLLVLFAVLSFGQALFAGQFLSGEGTWLAPHRVNGTAVIGTAMILLVAGAVLIRLLKGPFWPLVLVAALFAAQWFQIKSGLDGQLALHIPLGVAMVALPLLGLVMSFRPPQGARRP